MKDIHQSYYHTEVTNNNLWKISTKAATVPKLRTTTYERYPPKLLPYRSYDNLWKISTKAATIPKLGTTTYERHPPKLLPYRSYEHSWNDSLENNFKSEAYAIQSGDIGSLKSPITKSFNTVAPFKRRIVRRNLQNHPQRKSK